MRLIKYLFIFLCFAAYLQADRDDISREQSVTVLSSTQVHNGNYFATGRSVEILGTVNGDVYVFAEQVVIDGTVNGDVLGCCGSIDIAGTVSHNCRVAGGQVLIGGTVGRNVTAMAGNLQLLSSATIGGSLVATAGNIDLAGSIDTDATIVASNLRLSCNIKENLKGYVGQMRISSKAVIGGNVDYRSNTDAWIEPGSTIRGTVTHHPSFVHDLFKGTWIQGFVVGSKVLALLMNFIYTFVFGVILVKLFPKNLEATLRLLKHRPLKSFLYGLMLVILLPLAALILLMTIIGVPFALAVMAANIMGFYTAKVYTIFWGSNWLFGKLKMKQSRLPSYFFGVIIYFGLTEIPFFGTGVSIGAMLFGLGAGVLTQTKRTFSHRATQD